MDGARLSQIAAAKHDGAQGPVARRAGAIRSLPTIAVLSLCVCVAAQCIPPTPGFPGYCAATVVNTADGIPGVLAPNTIATVNGQNLSYTSASLTTADVSSGGVLPTQLPGTATHVLVGNLEATPFSVSPTQISFLVPPNLLPGKTPFVVVNQGLAGPVLTLDLQATAPAFFLSSGQDVAALRLDDSAITAASPAQPGEIVMLYATGLGATNPPAATGQLPTLAASLVPEANLQILLNGEPVSDDYILYAGVAPFFAGLYQINLQLPSDAPANPEIRLVCAGETSPAQVYLNVQP